MDRVKNFDATGIAPGGKLYAGDLNAIQDAAAALYSLLQNLGVASVAIGEASLLLSRYGAGEARISGALRTDGIVRALGGLYAGAFTTTQRNALTVAQRPYGLVILNTTTNQYEWNKGTDITPDWQPISTVLGADSITSTHLAPDSVGSSEIQTNAVGAAELADGIVDDLHIASTLKPSAGAGPSVEALRALGTGATQAAAGNDARLSDARTPVLHAASHARGGSDPVLVNNSIDAGHIGPGAGGADDFGTSFPSTGLFNGYRFTIFLNNLAYHCIYRSDIDATFPWQVQGGPTLVVTTTDLNYVTAAWATFLQLQIPKTGLWKVHVGTHAIVVQGVSEVNRVLTFGFEVIRNSVFTFGNSHVLIDWESSVAMSAGQWVEVQHISNGSDGQHSIANITVWPLRLQ